MKSLFHSALLLFTCFIVMVIINESKRKSNTTHNYKVNNTPTINTTAYDKSICTWACHNATSNHCKIHHATTVSSYFKWIDPIYFSMINGLHGTGNYRMANVMLLAILWPLFISYLIVKIIQMRKELYHG